MTRRPTPSHAYRLDRVGGRPHLGFGLGRHDCLGAHLARMYLHVLIGEAVARWAAVQPDGLPTVRFEAELTVSRLPLRIRRS